MHLENLFVYFCVGKAEGNHDIAKAEKFCDVIAYYVQLNCKLVFFSIKYISYNQLY